MAVQRDAKPNAADMSRLGEELGVFSRRYYDWLTEKMKPLEVNPGRRRILRLLRENGPLNMSQLAFELQLDPKRMTTLVDLLESSGYVERKTDPEDRRTKFVQLTALGQERWAPINESFGAIVATLAADFTEEELATLEDLIGRLTLRMRFPASQE